MAKHPNFIVFEGIDGSGKSTQAKLLAKKLESQGKKVHLTRQPTNRFVGQSIRKVLQKEITLPHEALAALFLADRYDHILGENGMLQYLDQGYIVLCDRYYWSSFAYHSLDLPLEFLIAIHTEVMQVLQPGITIYLDVDPHASIDRISKRSNTTELFEKTELLSRIRTNYIKAFESLPEQKVIQIDGAQSIEEIHNRIIQEF